MSFDLTAKRTAWIAVTFAGMSSDGDDLSKPIEHPVELLVDLVDLDEFGRLFISPLDDEGNPRPDANPPATPERVAEWRAIDDTVRALAIVQDWRGVKAGTRTLPFDEDNLRKLMRVPNFAVGLFLKAYPAAYAGLKDTRLGNLEGSPENGPGTDAEPQ